jgi:uncharacterized protein (DUF924 family)
MRGGVDDAILRDFGPITEAAARGELDHWADTPRGRLALLIALDQFPAVLLARHARGLCAGHQGESAGAGGLENGHYEALPEAWERQFYIIALGHCEGPDHLARLDLSLKLAEAQKDVMRPELLPMADRPVQQVMRVRSVIERFGRHPHRNADYGRLSSPEEEAYIAAGDFPHQGKIELPGQNAG